MPLRLLILALLLYMAFTWLRTSLRHVMQGVQRPGGGTVPGEASDGEHDRASICPFCGVRLPTGSASRCTRCGTLFQEGEYRA